ncbi:MAG: preprotein translocase subunit SecG [Pseudomonadota bacterium]
MNAELTEQLILVVHLLLALAIIGLIMLQQGKGADMGASFGAGASQTLFGSSGGGNVLTKTTAWMVALFFATSFGLAVIAKNKTTSVDEFDLPIPEAAAEQAPSTVNELPSTDVPEMPSSDIPALQGEELGKGGRRQRRHPPRGLES